MSEDPIEPSAFTARATAKVSQNQDEMVRATLRAAYRVLTDSKLRDQLRDDQAAPDVLHKLGVVPATRAGLLQVSEIVDTLKQDGEQSDEGSEAQDSHRWSFVILLTMSAVVFLAGLAFLAIAIVRASRGETDTATFAIAGLGLGHILVLFYLRPWEGLEAQHRYRLSSGASPDEMGRILLRSFDHIQWSFVVLLTMSAVVFLAGLAFLAIAIVRASRGETDTATFVIAGVGLADIVLLFYKHPWRDITQNLSNTQRVKFVATSYLAGLSLLRTGDNDKIELLERLTGYSIFLLERQTDEHVPSSRSPDRQQPRDQPARAARDQTRDAP